MRPRLPILLEENEDFILQPEHIQSICYDFEGHLESLVYWMGLLVYENLWMRMKDITREFPHIELLDKLAFTNTILIKR